MSSLVVTDWLVLAVAFFATVTDCRTGRIPNVVTVPLLVVAPLVHFRFDGPGGLVVSLLGALVCSATPLFLFCRGAMGGGDVKLLAGIGAALGAANGLEVQIVAYLATALYAVTMLAVRGGLSETLRGAAALFVAPLRKAELRKAPSAEMVRMGAFIFVAAALCLGRTVSGL